MLEISLLSIEAKCTTYLTPHCNLFHYNGGQLKNFTNYWKATEVK